MGFALDGSPACAITVAKAGAEPGSTLCGTALMSPGCDHAVPESGVVLLGQGRLLCCTGSAPSVPLQAKESWEMDTKEKLEQAAVVKEKGTMYFKVCDLGAGRGRGGELGLNLAAISVREAMCPQIELGKVSPALPLPLSHSLMLPKVSPPFPALPWLRVLPAEQDSTSSPCQAGANAEGLCIPLPSWSIPAPHCSDSAFPEPAGSVGVGILLLSFIY